MPGFNHQRPRCDRVDKVGDRHDVGEERPDERPQHADLDEEDRLAERLRRWRHHLPEPDDHPIDERLGTPAQRAQVPVPSSRSAIASPLNGSSPDSNTATGAVRLHDTPYQQRALQLRSESTATPEPGIDSHRPDQAKEVPSTPNAGHRSPQCRANAAHVGGFCSNTAFNAASNSRADWNRCLGSLASARAMM